MDRNKHTLCHPWRRLNATSFTGVAFTAKTPTLTEPSGNGVLNLQDQNIAWVTDQSHVPDLLMVLPYGTDANNEAFQMRAWGWSKCTSVTGLWIPTLLLENTVTLGNISGGGATGLGANSYLADTITLDYGSTTLHVVSSTANDTPAMIALDTLGSLYVEFDFAVSTAASANVLVRGVS